MGSGGPQNWLYFLSWHLGQHCAAAAAALYLCISTDGIFSFFTFQYSPSGGFKKRGGKQHKDAFYAANDLAV